MCIIYITYILDSGRSEEYTGIVFTMMCVCMCVFFMYNKYINVLEQKMWFYLHINKFVSIKSLIFLEGSNSEFDQYIFFKRERRGYKNRSALLNIFITVCINIGLQIRFVGCYGNIVILGINCQKKTQISTVKHDYNFLAL